MSTLVMGVVNVTPDSFSDGGEWFEPDAAVAHGLQLIEQGADLLDVGGESTRPGAERPTEQEELRRVLPVVAELSRHGARISVDTMRAEVAAQALQAGASVVNDVSGGLADPEMAAVVAGSGAQYVAMHWRAHSTHMQSLASYDDVVQDVCRELTGRVDDLCARGVRREQIVLDPGLRVRQAGRAQLAAAGPPRPGAGAGLPGARRHLAQVVPRPAGRAGRCPAPAGGRARRGDRGDHGHRRPGRRVGGAGAPRALQRRRAARRGRHGGGPMSDRISLRGVRARGFHGVLAHEKVEGQDFVVDVLLDVDLSRAAGTDDLAHTVSYAEVAADVVALVEGGSLDLIETLASPDRRRDAGPAAGRGRRGHRPQAAGAGRRPVR